MHDRTNKTSICSILFLDIIDYSKKSDADQIEVKNQFNDLVNRSLKGVAQNDRIILDTGDGVAIAYMGSPEDAMFVALTIRDDILKINLYNSTPLYVRFGINLGPVRIVTDINGQPNIIGDGINVAQRIMSFAQSNQILVSRSYYEVTSRLTVEFSEMFDYSGIKHDKHVREHEVYSVRQHKDSVEYGSQPIAPKDDRRLVSRLVTAKMVNLKYVALALPALIAFVLSMSAILGKSAQVDMGSHATLTPEKNPGQENPIVTELAKTEPTKKETNNNAKHKEMNKKPPEFVPALAASHSISPGITKEVRMKSTAGAAKTTELTVDKETSKKKLGWNTIKKSVKLGSYTKCSQAQISMNHCS